MSVDYDGSLARNFSAGEASLLRLSRSGVLRWSPISRAGRILDVGSGASRLAILMAEWFGAVVIGSNRPLECVTQR